MLQYKIREVRNRNQLLVKIMVEYYKVRIIDNSRNMVYNLQNLQMRQQNNL
jgi:hypothetical protein